MELTSASINIKGEISNLLLPCLINPLLLLCQENSESERILGKCVLCCWFTVSFWASKLSIGKEYTLVKVNFSQASPGCLSQVYCELRWESSRHLPSSPSHTAIPRLLSHASSQAHTHSHHLGPQITLCFGIPCPLGISFVHATKMSCVDPEGWSQILLHYTGSALRLYHPRPHPGML